MSDSVHEAAMVESASHFYPVVASYLTSTNELVILGGRVGAACPRKL